MAALEAGMIENTFVDFRRRGNHYECTSFNAIRDISNQVQAYKFWDGVVVSLTSDKSSTENSTQPHVLK